MPTETKDDERAEQQAACQMESVREMVAAMECDYERLAELDDLASGTAWNGTAEESQERAELHAAATLDSEMMRDADQARERIQEDALSVQVRSGWYSPGADKPEPEEYEILLCTGGPAARIVGELSGGSPSSARLEYQDWGTPWAEYIVSPYQKHSEDVRVLLAYANVFYFGD